MTAPSVDQQPVEQQPADRPPSDEQQATDALAPVRAALLRLARDEAEATRTAAEQDAQAVLDDARRQADELRHQAQADGAADAQSLRAEQQMRARRRARAVVLAAQREALDSLTRQVHARVQALWQDPDTQEMLRARLTERAQHDLGDDVTVTPHPEGGVQARSGSRRVAYVLTDLADEIIAGLPDLAGLWTP